jgi:hypothetical protein
MSEIGEFDRATQMLGETIDLAADLGQSVVECEARITRTVLRPHTDPDVRFSSVLADVESTLVRLLALGDEHGSPAPAPTWASSSSGWVTLPWQRRYWSAPPSMPVKQATAVLKSTRFSG